MKTNYSIVSGHLITSTGINFRASDKALFFTAK